MSRSVFDADLVTRRLRFLPWSSCVAFGAACGSRLVSNYSRFREETGWGDLGPLNRALDVLWSAATAQEPPLPAGSNALIAACEAQVPDSESFSSLFTSSAQDAVFAVCSVLDYCIERRPEQVTSAARYPTDSIDLFVQELEQIDPSDPMLENKVLGHRLMQQELQRQERDLAALESRGANAVAELLLRRGAEHAFR